MRLQRWIRTNVIRESSRKIWCSGPITTSYGALRKNLPVRDPFTSLLIINGTPYRRSYRQLVHDVLLRSILHGIYRVSSWESEEIHMSGPAKGKEGDPRERREKEGLGTREERVDRRVGTKETHNSPRCSLVAWLSRGERGEHPSDWSSQERSFADAIFDFAWPNGLEKFNLTGCLIEQWE